MTVETTMQQSARKSWQSHIYIENMSCCCERPQDHPPMLMLVEHMRSFFVQSSSRFSIPRPRCPRHCPRPLPCPTRTNRCSAWSIVYALARYVSTANRSCSRNTRVKTVWGQSRTLFARGTSARVIVFLIDDLEHTMPPSNLGKRISILLVSPR